MDLAGARLAALAPRERAGESEGPLRLSEASGRDGESRRAPREPLVGERDIAHAMSRCTQPTAARDDLDARRAEAPALAGEDGVDFRRGGKMPPHPGRNEVGASSRAAGLGLAWSALVPRRGTDHGTALLSFFLLVPSRRNRLVELIAARHTSALPRGRGIRSPRARHGRRATFRHNRLAGSTAQPVCYCRVDAHRQYRRRGCG